MIHNQWYIIALPSEVHIGKIIQMRRLGKKLVLWRNPDQSLGCITDRCPHRGASLGAGKVVGECVQCPFHGFEFRGDGSCRFIPANGRNIDPPKSMHAQSYPVREAHGWIYLWNGEERENYPPLPWISTIDESKFARTVITSHWKANYTRAIENQLDVVHLPFVHHNTIGSGGRTLVNGPLYSWETPDLLNVWVENELDEGQKPHRASEIQLDRKPQLQFHMPNLWQNWIGDHLRIFAAFVPVDNANTRIYIATYQRFVTAPGLRHLFALANNAGNRIILRQDQRVVETQLPLKAELKSGEILIPGDGPIIAYRRRRKELLDRDPKLAEAEG